MTCLAVGVLLPKSVKKFINHLYCSTWSITENNSSEEENRYEIAEQVKPGRNDILCPPHLTKPNGHECNTEYWILNILEKWNVEIWPPHNRSFVEFAMLQASKAYNKGLKVRASTQNTKYNLAHFSNNSLLTKFMDILVLNVILLAYYTTYFYTQTIQYF